MQRFPNARIFNTYGQQNPQCHHKREITGELNRTVSLLPVGCVKPGTKVAIYNPMELRRRKASGGDSYYWRYRQPRLF